MEARNQVNWQVSMDQETVNIILVDRQRLMKASLFSDVKSKVEADLNKLFQNDLKLSFKVIYRASYLTVG
jgi:hypothetical protein